MASARRTGTNEHVRTFGTAGAGRDYTALATWEAVFDVDLTNMWKVTITGLNGTFQLNESLNFVGGATGIFIENPSGEMIFVKTAGTPLVNDVITGVTSLATATLSAITFSNGVSPVLECYDDAASFNDYLYVYGATTTSSYFRIIRPASGQGHDGTPNNGVTFICTTNADLIAIEEANFQVQDIIGKLNINSINYKTTFSMGWVGINCAFVGCIAFDSINVGTGVARGFDSGDIQSGGAYFIDCLAHNCEGTGFTANAYIAGSAYFYNCTATNNGTYGFSNLTPTGKTAYYKNCLGSGNTTNDFYKSGAGTSDVSYCASGDATADDWGGTGNRISQAFSFLNSGGDDFHLTSSDVGAKNFGTDLSADAAYPFNDDIDKTTRPGESVWDIGFDEYFSLGSPKTKQFGGIPFMNIHTGRRSW